eukprot:UN07121
MPSFFLLDPTVLFSIVVVFIPVAFEVNNPNFVEVIKPYLLYPPFLICWALIILLEIGSLLLPQKTHVSRRKKVKTTTYILSNAEYMASRWYLLNGLMYHLLMDPVTGFWQNWSLMTKHYNFTDERFSNPYKVGAEAATLTVWLEGAVMCPLCVLLFIGYRYILPRLRSRNTAAKNNSKYGSIVWIYCLEFVVGLCQSLGTYFFYGSEMMLLLSGRQTDMPYAKSWDGLNFNIWEC